MTWSGRSLMACPLGAEEGEGRSARGRGFLLDTIDSFAPSRRQSVAISGLTVGRRHTNRAPRPPGSAGVGPVVQLRSDVLAPASAQRVRRGLRLPVAGEHTLL